MKGGGDEYLQEEGEEIRVDVAVENQARLGDEHEEVDHVVEVVLVEGLAQNVQLANHLAGRHGEAALVVELEQSHDLVLDVVANLAVVLHAETEEERKRALHDPGFPQLRVRFLHEQDLRQTGGERADRGRFHIILVGFVDVHQYIQAVVALQSLHVVRNVGKHELEQIEELKHNSNGR